MDPRQLLVELLCESCEVTPDAIADGSRLRDDLHLDGDDYGLRIVPELERRLQFEAPLAAWNQVRTVGDMLRVVNEFMPPST